MLINVRHLISTFYNFTGKLKNVAFGTSGHRGTSLDGSFNRQHIEAITQAICEYRTANSITGPLYLGFDTHGLSTPAFKVALKVLHANGVKVIVNRFNEYTPTPVISRMIIRHNQMNGTEKADGIVITPSHNGPGDGGFKYNPPHGGPADVDATGWIEKRANEIMTENNKVVKLSNYYWARYGAQLTKKTVAKDFVAPFVEDLGKVIDFTAIREAKLKIGVDPMGGAGVHYWRKIAKRYGIRIDVVNKKVDPQFGFMTLDHDGKIRMDCSSKYAMAGLIGLKDQFDIAFGNDPDYDRHGIVTPEGLMNPNHFLAVAIWYLLQNRPEWAANLKIGKTLVSSSMIDKVVADLGHELYEVPVGFKWFVDGLAMGWLAFGGEESAGATFLCMDGSTWTTDKDGFALALLAAEIRAKTGLSPQHIYDNILVPKYGNFYYDRNDVELTETSAPLFRKSAKELATRLKIGDKIAGRKIVKVIITAPGNNAPMGGAKVFFDDGSWFAVRASGTELKGKIYIETFGAESLTTELKALWENINNEVEPIMLAA